MNVTSRRYKRRRPIAEINVVPYIDVTLVLLIIFMMTAPLQQSAVQIELPTSNAVNVEQKAQLPVTISIEKNGDFYLSETENDEKRVGLSELLVRIATLQQNSPQLQVYIKGDKAVAYGQVVSVMAALKEAGVSHVELITRSAEP